MWFPARCQPRYKALGTTYGAEAKLRCRLQGALGDAPHALSAAGYNIRWLMRAIACPGLKPAFLRLLTAAVTLTTIVMPTVAPPLTTLARLVVSRLVCLTSAPSVVWA